MSEYVSLRVPEKVMRKLHRLKAKMILQREAKVSDAQVVSEAIEVALAQQDEASPKKKMLSDSIGIIKGGPRTNAALDHDDVLYGD